MLKLKSRKASRRRQHVDAISHPPAIGNQLITVNKVMRFTSNAAFDASITYSDLLDTWLVASTATVGHQLFTAVKVNSVKVWGMPIIGSSSTVAVTFGSLTTGFVGDRSVHTDTSMGVQPAHVNARPKAKSLASMFQVAGNVVAFTLTCPSGSVIDVDVTFKSTLAYAVTAQAALSSATAGYQYFRGLDGEAKAASVLLPAARAGDTQ